MTVKRILKTSGCDMPTFTGRTKQMVSPLTGRLATYLESYQIHVTSPAAGAPNLDDIKAKINTDCLTQNVDSSCDSILLIQGAVQDTYKVRHWVAEEQPNLAMAHPELMRTGTMDAKPLFSEIVILAIIIIISITVGAIVILAIVNSWFNSAMSVAQQLLPGKPTYVGPDPNDPNKAIVYNDYTAYLTGQHLLYWYVCPKCGAGYGLKSSYPNITDVPAEEKAAFDEHVGICEGIPQTNYGFDPFFIYIIIAASAGIAVLYIVMKAFTSKTTERIVERIPTYR